MRKTIFGVILTLISVMGHAQTLGVTLLWTTPSAAATVTANSSGVETSGPVTSFVYRASATITSGVATCPTFSTSSYTLLTTNGVAGTSSAANANTYVDTTVTVGQVYCDAVTNQFQAGGTVSAATVSAPIVTIILGTAAQPTNLGATFGVVN